MFEPSRVAEDWLLQRTRRLHELLKRRSKGEQVPTEIVDDFARQVREALDRWESERKAGSN